MQPTILAREFAREWFANPSWWFNKDPTQLDAQLTLQYASLLSIQAPFSDSHTDVIDFILIHDQLARHVHRGHPSIIQRHLDMCLPIAKALVQSEEPMTVLEWCFVCLPIRHAYDWPTLEEHVMKRSWAWLDRLDRVTEDYTQMKRFLRAMYQNVRPPHCALVQHVVADVKASFVDWTPFVDILKYHPEDPLREIIQDTHASIVRGFIDVPKPCIISISGGVDSMVSSYLLHRLTHPHQNVCAVHINYGNKITCMNDEAFVKAWCRAHRIPLYVRHIRELNRLPCMTHELRDMYETYTRNVRYETYKYVWNECLGFQGIPPKVILGHNKDDCFENILTNITQGQKMEQLRGMSWCTPQDGIDFIRPMLEIPKHVIRTFAMDHHIPHLQDSTPAWSQRGKIRDMVVPTLNAWDPRCIPGLFDLADVMQDMYEVLQRTVEDWIERTIDNMLTLRTQEMVSNVSLWRCYVAHCLACPPPSHKAMLAFKDRVDAWKYNGMCGVCTVVLKKNVRVQFQKMGEMVRVKLTISS